MAGAEVDAGVGAVAEEEGTEVADDHPTEEAGVHTVAAEVTVAEAAGEICRPRTHSIYRSRSSCGVFAEGHHVSGSMCSYFAQSDGEGYWARLCSCRVETKLI